MRPFRSTKSQNKQFPKYYSVLIIILSLLPSFVISSILLPAKILDTISYPEFLDWGSYFGSYIRNILVYSLIFFVPALFINLITSYILFRKTPIKIRLIAIILMPTLLALLIFQNTISSEYSPASYCGRVSIYELKRLAKLNPNNVEYQREVGNPNVVDKSNYILRELHYACVLDKGLLKKDQ